MSESTPTSRTRWINVSIYLVVCIGLLILAGLVHADSGVRPVAVIGAVVMFGFALWDSSQRVGGRHARSVTRAPRRPRGGGPAPVVAIPVEPLRLVDEHWRTSDQQQGS
jgi:hypothetical protein